ncbi:MAG: 16S rRNA (uracil(1498)-N(3))-methyltransferase [Gammaproteobacteria bacterium]
MRIPRIFLPLPLAPDALVTLDHTAANHVTRVLRLKPGAELVLFNGEGGESTAILEEVARTLVTARITAFRAIECESPLSITLAQGISRAERMDYTIQKAVELGVARIVPVFTARGMVDLRGERLQRRLQHWQGVIIGACEQCGRNRVPRLEAAAELGDWLCRVAPDSLRVVLNHRATDSLRTLAPTSALTLLIGPEGGLEEKEVAQAERAGFVGVRLGPRVLRTETAAVTALAALQTLWGDF